MTGDKAQGVRLLDVFVLGPFMVWNGLRLGRLGHPAAGGALAVAGVLTVLYNWDNYQATAAAGAA